MPHRGKTMFSKHATNFFGTCNCTFPNKKWKRNMNQTKQHNVGRYMKGGGAGGWEWGLTIILATSRTVLSHFPNTVNWTNWYLQPGMATLKWTPIENDRLINWQKPLGQIVLRFALVSLNLVRANRNVNRNTNRKISENFEQKCQSCRNEIHHPWKNEGLARPKRPRNRTLREISGFSPGFQIADSTRWRTLTCVKVHSTKS